MPKHCGVSVIDGLNLFDSLCNLLNHKHPETQSILLEFAGYLTNLVNNVGVKLLHYAAQSGHVTATQYLIGIGCKIDALDESGDSPLMMALKYDHVDTIEVLLHANADLNICDDIGRTILQSVLQSGASTRSAKVKNLFLQKVIAMCSNDDTMIANKLVEVGCNLIEAIRLNRPRIVKVMLEKGISIEDRDVNCNTPLHVAVELMNLEIIKLLIEHGARVNARGCRGRTPLFKFDMKFQDSEAKLEILRFLLDHGAGLTILDFFGTTPLTFFLCGGDRETLQIVMQYGVDLRGLNKFHQNPLHYLVENKNPGVLEVIRGKRFPVDVCNSLGLTPLWLAVKNYDLEKIEFLLEHGADVNTPSLDGHTPLVLLFMDRLEDEKNAMSILELLLEHEADAEVLFMIDMTIFDLAEKNDFYFRVKPVIARLAMLEMLGKPINKYIRYKINCNLTFDIYYEKCKQQISQLKCKIIHGSVSLFGLLFEDEEKLVVYARNPEFESKFTLLMDEVDDVDAYILERLSKRVNKAMKIAETREKAASAISRITDLPISTCHTILYRIVDYLGNQELENLLNI